MQIRLAWDISCRRHGGVQSESVARNPQSELIIPQNRCSYPIVVCDVMAWLTDNCSVTVGVWTWRRLSGFLIHRLMRRRSVVPPEKLLRPFRRIVDARNRHFFALGSTHVKKWMKVLSWRQWHCLDVSNDCECNLERWEPRFSHLWIRLERVTKHGCFVVRCP